MFKGLVKWARVKSPWILHMNCGSCNGCDIEILAALIPRLDAERFGVLLKGTPRHADVLVCTGPVTKQMKERLRRVYDQMPEPKFVVVVGQCGSSGGIYKGCVLRRRRNRHGHPSQRVHPRLSTPTRCHRRWSDQTARFH